MHCCCLVALLLFGVRCAEYLLLCLEKDEGFEELHGQLLVENSIDLLLAPIAVPNGRRVERSLGDGGECHRLALRSIHITTIVLNGRRAEEFRWWSKGSEIALNRCFCHLRAAQQKTCHSELLVAQAVR